MSKRLKKRIQEVCGLTNLSREDKARRAHSILNDTEEKQRICNEILGIKFKDIENTLQDIISSKKFSSKDQDEESEILAYAPEKINGPTKPTMAKSSMTMEYLLNRDEVNALIHASFAPWVEESTKEVITQYASYSQDEVNALLACDYNPEHFKYRKN